MGEKAYQRAEAEKKRAEDEQARVDEERARATEAVMKAEEASRRAEEVEVKVIKAMDLWRESPEFGAPGRLLSGLGRACKTYPQREVKIRCCLPGRVPRGAELQRLSKAAGDLYC